MGATGAIASFVAGEPPELSADVIGKATKAIADTLAAMLSGAGSEVAAPLLRYSGAGSGRGPAPLLGTGLRAGPETAALVNGAFGHALDYDDVLSLMPGHPSAVVLAAVLAACNGEAVTGRRLIEAYLVGVEVGARLGIGITQGHYRRGFHATGTLGIFSAAAALAHFGRLDETATRHALGIAASSASGLRRNFGTMTKALHSGLAARGALTAVRLAQCGLAAAPDILEAPAGFFAAYGVAESDAGVAARDLGRPWVVADPGLALKKFPCCYAAHRAMDGLLALRARLGFEAGSVERILCRMPPGGMRVLTYPRPVTGLQGKFSLPYALAAGALDGCYALDTFTDAAVRRPEIESLYSRIEAAEDPSCRGEDPRFDERSSGSRGFVEVEVRLRDGRGEHVRVERAPGAPGRELSWDDLHQKFIDCARRAPRTGADTGERAFALIRRLDELEDIAQVVTLLS